FAVEVVDRQVFTVEVFELLELQQSFDGDRFRREVRRTAGEHLHDDAVVQRSAGTEAARLIVAYQDERRYAGLERATRMDVPADFDLLSKESADFVGQQRLDKRLFLFQREDQIVERQRNDAARGRRRRQDFRA